MSESSPYKIEPASPDSVRALEHSAQPDLARFFEMMKATAAATPGWTADALYGAPTLRILGVRPAIFQSWFTAEYYTIKQGEVPAQLKELVASVVSKANEEEVCHSCAPYHAGAARLEGASADSVAAVAGQRLAELPAAERAVIEFGLKCAQSPREVSDEDIQAMRKLGYSEAAIVEIAASALLAYSLSAMARIFSR